MGFLLNDNVGYAGPQAGNIARQGYPVYNQAQPVPQPAPIMNGVPGIHPIESVAQLLNDHSNVLRARLFAAHAQQGLAPEQVSEHGQFHSNPLDIVRQTRATGTQNLAALLARFHGLPGMKGNIDPGFSRPDMHTYDLGGGFRQPGGFQAR